MKTLKSINPKIKKISRKSSLSQMAADQMLQNVFTVCETESNSVPLEVIEDFANYEKERFVFIRTILTIIIILLLFVPFLFVKGSVNISERQVEQSPVYDIRVKSLFSAEITAMQGGHHLPVYRTGLHTYCVEPTKNGAMDICVTFFNHQEITQTVQVIHADTLAPHFVNSQVSDQKVFLFVEDNESGIDYDGIYAMDSLGGISYPLSYDSVDGCIVFECPASAINVYIPDLVGNELILILTPNN